MPDACSSSVTTSTTHPDRLGQTFMFPKIALPREKITSIPESEWTILEAAMYHLTGGPTVDLNRAS